MNDSASTFTLMAAIDDRKGRPICADYKTHSSDVTRSPQIGLVICDDPGVGLSI